MKKIIIFLILFLFVASQVYLLYANSNLKHEVALKDRVLGEQTTKYYAVQPLLELGLQNIGCMIDGDISIEDTTKSVFRLRDVINGNTLVCRISDRYCTQCVEHAVSVLTDNKSAFEFTKVLFPYFMVMDSSFTVQAVYVPSKSTHGTDFDFRNVKLMYDNLVDIEL